MKRAFTTLVLVAIGCAVGVYIRERRLTRESLAPVTSERLTHVIEQLRHEFTVDGKAQVGLGEMNMSGYDPFYLLVRYVAGVATPPDFDLLLDDKSGAVRVAAAMAILKFSEIDMKSSAVDRLLEDREEIVVFDASCIPRRMTVGEVVAGLKRDPNFLDVPEAPSHQPLEPAATSFTPSAASESHQR